jgi:hypothetical protein
MSADHFLEMVSKKCFSLDDRSDRGHLLVDPNPSDKKGQ